MPPRQTSRSLCVPILAACFLLPLAFFLSVPTVSAFCFLSIQQFASFSSNSILLLAGPAGLFLAQRLLLFDPNVQAYFTILLSDEAEGIQLHLCFYNGYLFFKTVICFFQRGSFVFHDGNLFVFHHGYRGTSLTGNYPPLRTTVGPYAQSYCIVLGGSSFF